MAQDNNPIAEAMAVLSQAMADDSDYRFGWQSNIAMLLHDEGVPLDIANDRANGFLKTAFGV